MSGLLLQTMGKDMRRNKIVPLAILIAILFIGNTPLLSAASTVDSKIPQDLLKDVQALKLQRGDYVLGMPLTSEQLEVAKKHGLPKTAPGTFRFKDGELQIVAEEGSNIVIAISEYHPKWTQKQVKDLVGEFTLGFGFPTATAHGRTLYWFYATDGRLLEEVSYKDYVMEHGKYSVIATIKMQTGSLLLNQDSKQSKSMDDEPDSVYYVIYSNPILELFVTKNHRVGG